MALTEEQINNLKPGDIVDVRGFVNLPLCNGNILVELRYEFDHRILPAYNQISTEFISIPGEPEEKSKYDPCRLFRKGDIVRLKEWNGRCPALPEDWKFDDGLFEVHTPEKFNSSVEITRENSKAVYIVPICFLELVTPVEELDPYSIEEVDVDSIIFNPKLDPDRDSESAFHVRYMDKRSGEITIIKTYYESDIYSYDKAKADAEAECNRLNAEHRKEHRK